MPMGYIYVSLDIGPYLWNPPLESLPLSLDFQDSVLGLPDLSLLFTFILVLHQRVLVTELFGTQEAHPDGGVAGRYSRLRV